MISIGSACSSRPGVADRLESGVAVGAERRWLFADLAAAITLVSGRRLVAAASREEQDG